MSKKQKIILTAFVLMLVAMTLGFNHIRVAQAQDNNSSALTSDSNAPTNALEDVATMAVYPVVLGINLVLSKIGGIFFTFAGYLVDLALRLNTVIISPMVNTGWGIVLSFANLGFVLAIIVIAIATILRVQQYGAKNLLGKLIAAALLVNFSLMIAGVFLDSADVFTRFFNKQFGSANLSTKITKLIQPQTLSDPFSSGGQMGFLEKYSRTVLKLVDIANPFYWTGYTKGLENDMWGDNKSLTSGNWLMILASFFFGIIFTFLSVLTLLAVGIMLFIRYIYLGILLIVSPIVWLFWIFPGTSNLWGQWWKNFLRWTFFAPIMMFFLFLAISLMGSAPLNQPTNQEALQFVQQFQAKQQGLPIDLMKFGNMVVVLGLLLGGLIAANSMGIHGSKAFMGIAQGAGKWARGRISGLAAGGTQRTFMGGVKRDPKTGEVTTRGQRMATAISRVPGFSGAAQRISAFSSPQAKAEDVEKYRKNNLTSLTNEALLRQMTAPGAFANRTAAAAMIQDAARRGLTDDKRLTSSLERYIETAQGMGNINTVLNNRPDLAPIAAKAKTDVEKTEAIKKVMNRIRADKADEISHEAFKNENVVLGLNNAHLERLARVGEPRQREAIDKIIKASFGPQLTLIKKIKTDMNKIKQSITDATAKNDKNLAIRLIKQRDDIADQEKTLVSGLNAKDKKILEHDTFISQNPNWQT